MTKTKVFIDGSAGTTGLRIHERLSSRTDVELITLDDEHRKDLKCRKEAIESADAAFLCLPDAASKEIIEAVVDCTTKIIDTSTAHRTNPAWAYGFPELSEEFYQKIADGAMPTTSQVNTEQFLNFFEPILKGKQVL